MIRFIAPITLLILALVLGFLTIRHPLAVWLLIPTAILIGVAIWDAIQVRHSLRRNYPLIARFRWLFEDLRPYLRSYIVESNQEGRPFDKNARALVYARSKNEISAHPFGTELDVYSDEYEWLGHSIAPNDSAPDEFRVQIGGPQCTQPYSAAILNISAMSFGALGGNAIEALNMGAKKGGFYHDTGEGSFSKYHAKHGGDIVWELGSGYFGCRDDHGRFDEEKFRETAKLEQIKMIEIKLSQGAKPGHGGVLPGAKVTREIAETRGVSAGENCISPAAHSAFSTPIELLEFAAKLRKLSGGKPVGIKLCVGQPHEVFAIMKAMIESDILLDFIVVDGAEGGTGAAPVELSNRVGMPLREGLILVRNALAGAGLKDRIKLGASGKVVSGAGLAINAALGADWSNAARAFMFSLGCVQSMKCHTGDCPTGVATQDPSRQRGLVIEDKAERVYQFQKQTASAFRDIVVAMGLDAPSQIRPHHLYERLNSAKSSSIDHIYPFLKDGALLEDPDHTPYAHYWSAARANSFRAAQDVRQTLYDHGAGL
jgi:glutamate synthase domain-containing protein 2